MTTIDSIDSAGYITLSSFYFNAGFIWAIYFC
jgi:hypothetical protein